MRSRVKAGREMDRWNLEHARQLFILIVFSTITYFHMSPEEHRRLVNEKGNVFRTIRVEDA